MRREFRDRGTTDVDAKNSATSCGCELVLRQTRLVLSRMILRRRSQVGRQVDRVKDSPAEVRTDFESPRVRQVFYSSGRDRYLSGSIWSAWQIVKCLDRC